MPRRADRVWFVGLGLLVLGAAGSVTLSKRVDATPPREPLVTFPMHVDRWSGQRRPIGREVLSSLKLSDYVFADFVLPGAPAPVNFYVAFYDSQRKGISIHSPRTCIPGGGWSISSLRQAAVNSVRRPNGAPLRVNRVLISKGEDRQLVYYWFQQRGRNLTNEYLVKWYIFWDALTRNRTDGALVRLVTPIMRGEGETVAEKRLQTLLHGLYPRIVKYLPG